jgi:hypothetical protein
MIASVHQINAPGPEKELESGSGDGRVPPMNERLAKLEGVVDGLGRTQEFTLIAVIGVGAIIAAFVIGFGIYSLQRIDTMNDKIVALPAQINTDLRDITKTLAESITAAKQQQPQIILMPAPAMPPSTRK